MQINRENKSTSDYTGANFFLPPFTTTPSPDTHAFFFFSAQMMLFDGGGGKRGGKPCAAEEKKFEELELGGEKLGLFFSPPLPPPRLL